MVLGNYFINEIYDFDKLDSTVLRFNIYFILILLYILYCRWYLLYIHIYYSIINAYQIYQFEYENLEGTNERIIENLTDFQIGFLDKAIIRDFFFFWRNRKVKKKYIKFM